jgi:hypothetical protein
MELKVVKTIQPEPVDQAIISIVMDNSIDILMSNSEVANRFPLGPTPFEKPQPIAEHGFSVLIRTRVEDKHAEVLFDAGLSRRGILYVCPQNIWDRNLLLLRDTFPLRGLYT